MFWISIFIIRIVMTWFPHWFKPNSLLWIWSCTSIWTSWLWPNNIILFLSQNRFLYLFLRPCSIKLVIQGWHLGRMKREHHFWIQALLLWCFMLLLLFLGSCGFLNVYILFILTLINWKSDSLLISQLNSFLLSATISSRPLLHESRPASIAWLLILLITSQPSRVVRTSHLWFTLSIVAQCIWTLWLHFRFIISIEMLVCFSSLGVEAVINSWKVIISSVIEGCWITLVVDTAQVVDHLIKFLFFFVYSVVVGHSFTYFLFLVRP